MNVHKRTLMRLEQVYTVSRLVIGGLEHIAAATEGQGRSVLLRPPDWEVSMLLDGPGGVMCLEPIPGRERSVLVIERFYPVFKARQAGVTHASAAGELTMPWTDKRVLDLPYVHRLRAVQVAGRPYLIAATISGPEKKAPEDWSQPGAVYVGRIPELTSSVWEIRPVLEGLYQNHGLISVEYSGQPSLLVGCRNGLFRIVVPQRPESDWPVEKLLDRAVSDMHLFDLDGDGTAELVTIEPFHGNRLAVYRQTKNAWQPVYEAELEFGHVVWCGMILGRPAVVAGSRAGNRELSLYRPLEATLKRMEQIELDRGVEPTQVEVLHRRDHELLFSANHGTGELVLYRLEA